MNKYHAKKTALCAKCGAEQCGCLVNKIVFDSKKEGRYYQDLLLMKKAGQVIDIQLQPEFVLQEGFTKDGKRYRPIKYRADFLVTYADGRKEVIDVKGYRTKDFKLKQKLFEHRFSGLKIKME